MEHSEKGVWSGGPAPWKISCMKHMAEQLTVAMVLVGMVTSGVSRKSGGCLGEGGREKIAEELRGGPGGVAESRERAC